MKFIFIFAFLSSFILFSCMEEELPVTAYPRGDVQSGTAEMTSKYSNQVYYSFDQGKVVASNPYDIWDLAFRSYGDDAYHIILNGAKFMEAADMGEVAFESVLNRDNAEFRYDSTNGDYDNYALGKWWENNGSNVISKNHVYIINRGNNIANKKVGYIKMMIAGFENNEYKIKFANLDGSNEFVASIPRNEEYNFVHFSFSDGGKVVDVEPISKNWDIVFFKYIAFLAFEGGLLPYSVTGVMINDKYVEIASDTSMNFNDITLDSISKFIFSKKPDYIGHEWKSFTLNGESYAVRPEINYFLKDYNDFYWKFHFTFFYNDKGERGYPKFDFKKL